MAQKKKHNFIVGTGRSANGRDGTGGFMAGSKSASAESGPDRSKTSKSSADPSLSPAPPPIPSGKNGKATDDRSLRKSESVKSKFGTYEATDVASKLSVASRVDDTLPASDPHGDKSSVGDRLGDAGEGDDNANASNRRSAQRRPAGPVRERIAANDDVPSIGGLIYALQQKPSLDVYKYAAVGSVVWVLIGIGFAWVAMSQDIANGLTFAQLFVKPTTFLTLTGIVVPVAVIWFLAVLAWRAEELKLRSSTMTEVAVRLAEPDRLAEQSVASLGQAVRRQVSFMNDAVSRALGRAGELEALVHNEVSELERSYEDNERKIRGLINELAGERSALAGTGGEFAETLRSMSQEVPELIEKLSGQQSKLAGIIESAGDNLSSLESSLGTSVDRLEVSLGSGTEQLQTVLEGYTGAIDSALGSRAQEISGILEDHSSSIDTSLSKRTAELQDTLGTRADEMRGLLGDYTVGLAEALGNRTEKMESVFAEHMGAIDASISQRTDNLQTVFEEYGRALDSTLANRAEALDAQLVERTRALDHAFNHRLQLFDDSIKRSTTAIDTAVGEKALALTTALDTHANTFRETISQQASDLDESLVHGISAVRRSSENISRQSLKAIEGLASQSDMLKNVSENLLGQINGVSNRFDNQTQSIMNAANALESANHKIDTTLRSRHTDLSQTLDRMSGKADEFGRFIEGYSTSIEGTLNDAEVRARSAAKELQDGAFAQRNAVLADFDRLKSDTDLQGTRALEDLRTKFATVSDELTNQLGSISSTVDSTTDDLRKRAAIASSEIAREQQRLQAEIAAIPETTRAGADSMRLALQDQLNALERLTDISQSHAKGRGVRAPVGNHNAPAQPSPHVHPAAGDRGTGAGMPPPNAPSAPTSGASGSMRGLSSLSSSVARELAARGHPRGSSISGNVQDSGAQARQDVDSRARSGGAGGAVAAPSGNSRDAWSLGDLLHRASFEEVEGGASAPSPGSVQSGAAVEDGAGVAAKAASAEGAHYKGIDILQISRAIDPQVAAQVWERLRTGQKGFLERDMYTPEGRIVFDDVGYRCQSDHDVRKSVLEYLSDFEGALRDAEKIDPSGREVQSHLMSDPGRVYLFLAHVSGRLN